MPTATYAGQEVTVDDEGFFTDPTTDALDLGNLRNDDQGAVSLVLEPDTGRWQFVDIPYQSPDLEYSRAVAVAASFAPQSMQNDASAGLARPQDGHEGGVTRPPSERFFSPWRRSIRGPRHRGEARRVGTSGGPILGVDSAEVPPTLMGWVGTWRPRTDSNRRRAP